MIQMIGLPALMLAASNLGSAATIRGPEYALNNQQHLAVKSEANPMTTKSQWFIDDNVTEWRARSALAPELALISISVYETAQFEGLRYASVWYPPDTVPPPQQNFTDGLDPLASVDFFKQGGLIPSLISCFGSSANASCAGVGESRPQHDFYEMQCNMTQQEFQDEDAAAGAMILKSFTEYGDPILEGDGGRRYCAIWHLNADHNKHALETTLTMDYDYVNFFRSQASKPYWQVGYFAISRDYRQSCLFVDSGIGPWDQMYNGDRDILFAAAKSWSDFGWEMIHLQVGGGASTPAYTNLTTFSAIWTAGGPSRKRVWNVNATTFGDFQNRTVVISDVDEQVQSYMQDTGVRQAQVAISINGTLVTERAYTWAEPGRPQTHPSDVFMLASVSKMFCEAAIQSLYDAGTLNSSTAPFAGSDPRFQDYPWWQASSPPQDPRMKDITVQELLDHYAGFNISDPNGPGDIVTEMRDISHKFNVDRAPNISECVGYLRGFPLANPPGQNYSYSNGGYIVLSAIVETVTNQTYFDYVHSVVSPDVQIWHTNASYHTQDNVIQESLWTGPSVVFPESNNDVADVFGGDGIYKETAIGPSGLAASASTLALFLHEHGTFLQPFWKLFPFSSLIPRSLIPLPDVILWQLHGAMGPVAGTANEKGQCLVPTPGSATCPMVLISLLYSTPVRMTIVDTLTLT